MRVFHRFLIWPLIARLRPFEVRIRKSQLSLLLDSAKDFLEIKYVNFNIAMKMCIKVRAFNFCPFWLRCAPL